MHRKNFALCAIEGRYILLSGGIDKNLKTNNEAIKFFKEAKQDKKINLLCENGKIALENLIKKNEKYDVILIDADKENYINYFMKLVPLITSILILFIW